MVERFTKWPDSYQEFHDGERRAILEDAIRCYKFVIDGLLPNIYVRSLNKYPRNGKTFGLMDEQWERLMVDLRNDFKTNEVLITCVPKKEDYDKQTTLYS